MSIGLLSEPGPAGNEHSGGKEIRREISRVDAIGEEGHDGDLDGALGGDGHEEESETVCRPDLLDDAVGIRSSEVVGKDGGDRRGSIERVAVNCYPVVIKNLRPEDVEPLPARRIVAIGLAVEERGLLVGIGKLA